MVNHDESVSQDLSPRQVQSRLVERGHLPEELAMKLARVREVTESPGDDDGALPPPSIETGETMLVAVKALINLVNQKVVEKGL